MSSDSDIGNEVEAELEAKPRKCRTAPTRLTNSQKFELLEKYKRGKLDKDYNVIPDKKRKGEFKFIKRRVPLDLPPNYDNDDNKVNERLPVEQKPVEPARVEPVKSVTAAELLKEDKPKFPAEFFQFQSNINNSLQKTLDELQEKYNSLSNKFDEDRKAKPKRTVTKTKPKPKPAKPKSKQKKEERQSEEEYEVEYEYINEEPPQQPQMQQPTIETPQPEAQVYVPYIRRRNIDIRDY